jgi:MFS family permease
MRLLGIAFFQCDANSVRIPDLLFFIRKCLLTIRRMMFAIREMTCTAFYEHRRTPPSPTDRCAIREIDARLAREFTILAASTTIFGLVNLLVTGWSIKRYGVKRALMIQVFWPAVRLAVQNVGLMVGSNAGILIVQSSQVMTIVGGPSGYMLALNSFITDVVTAEQRTSSLGRLAGSMLVGSAVGFLIGGLVAEAFGVVAPFRMTLLLFFLSFMYVVLTLPSIPVAVDDTIPSEKPHGLMRFFGPLHVFTPQVWTLPNGRSSRQFGALTLGIGVFLAILATGCINMILQMYAMDEFGFSNMANGWLVFIYSSFRGVFLTFVFPRIIAAGRKWLQPKPDERTAPEAENRLETEPQHGTISAGEIEVTDALDTEAEPLLPTERNSEEETYEFDLVYARFSLLADGILIGLAVFVSKGWQMYILAALLPLAAGTGSSCKGTILQMIPSSERVDALSGITLVENVARLSTSEYHPPFIHSAPIDSFSHLSTDDVQPPFSGWSLQLLQK